MATFTEAHIRRLAQQRSGQVKTARMKLTEEIASTKAATQFDIFLSHSITDAEIVLGVVAALKSHNKTVYIDWIEDPHLERSSVTAATAETLRKRLRQCTSLIYLHSANSTASKWMPWELGYFDGLKGAVAILPVTRVAEEEFKGQEYLGIYPYVDEGLVGLSPKELRVKRSRTEAKSWAAWTASPRAFAKTS